MEFDNEAILAERLPKYGFLTHGNFIDNSAYLYTIFNKCVSDDNMYDFYDECFELLWDDYDYASEINEYLRLTNKRFI